MVFRICEKNERVLYRWNIVELQVLDHDDSGYQTSFVMTYYDSIGRNHHFGVVKIGRSGMQPGNIKDSLPQEFAKLPESYFSLGQDEYYYERIKSLDRIFGDEIRHSLLSALRDVAYDTTILIANLNEPVMEQSLLLNTVSDDDLGHRKAVAKITGQLNRMALKGGARLTKYHFTYIAPEPQNADISPAVLEFTVDPDSNPPTNVHAMIGRNGCGKTHLIHHMVQCLQNRNGQYGKFTYLAETETMQEFANVVCVAFSPFDSFPEAIKEKSDLPAVFVGLNEEIIATDNKQPIKNRLFEAIGKQFWKYLRNCLISNQRQQLWTDAISILQTSFNEYEREIITEILHLIKAMGTQFDETEFQQNRQKIMDLFMPLSSGHKVVLLTITSCVAEVEERSILFIDEPENHLHPPLLSALIRALSDLLRKRNGVAIVSTHSPIVLQEVPKSCVWLLTRYGAEDVKPERLKRETFGTSLGTLIDDAFAFEVNKSGFHKLMVEASKKYHDFDTALKAYHGQLGNEASILLRMLMYEKQWED